MDRRLPTERLPRAGTCPLPIREIERTKKTFCRLCEVNCGLEADVDAEGHLVEPRPDRNHPVSRASRVTKA